MIEVNLGVLIYVILYMKLILKAQARVDTKKLQKKFICTYI